MFNFTISTDNMAEAQAIINAINGQVTIVSTATPSVAPAPAAQQNTSSDVTPAQIEEALDLLCSMSSSELIDKFGEGNDKPYRVIKNLGIPAIVRQLGVTGDTYYTEADYDDVMNAIQFIIKDVSVGGMSHDQMEDLFGVRTSKNLFAQNTLDEIVRVLKDEDLI